MDLRLHLGKGHEVDAHAVFVFAQYLCQLQHLVQRQFAGVRRALEVDGAGGDAALHQLIAGHGAVDAAGEQKRRLAARAHGHAAHGLPFLDADVGVVADLDVEAMLWMVDVHVQFGIVLQNAAADLGGDLHGVHGKVLVRAAGEDLERAGERAHHFHALGGDDVKFLGQFPRGADRVDAEHAAHALAAGAHILHAGDVDARIGQPHLPAQGLDGAADVLGERLEKIRAVLPLQMDFAKAYQQNFSHVYLL